MTEENIKEIIQKDVVTLVPALQISIIKEYLFEKTGNHVDIVPPTGKVSIPATTRVGSSGFIFDNDLMNYYYVCARDYYKNKFKIT